MFKTGETVTVQFCVSDPDTAGLVDADALPTGTLVLNGVDNAATVTVTNLATGVYRRSRDAADDRRRRRTPAADRRHRGRCRRRRRGLARLWCHEAAGGGLRGGDRHGHRPGGRNDHGGRRDQSGAQLAQVTAYDAGVASGQGTTDANGKVVLNLAAGTYAIAIYHAGYTSGEETLTVPDDGDPTYSIAAIAPTGSVDPDWANCYADVYDKDGVLEADVVCSLRISKEPSGSGQIFGGAASEATSDANGRVHWDTRQSAARSNTGGVPPIWIPSEPSGRRSPRPTWSAECSGSRGSWDTRIWPTDFHTSPTSPYSHLLPSPPMAIKFEATGDFSDLIAENQRYQKQVASLTEQLHGVTNAADPLGKAGVKAFRDLQRAAEQARKSIETPTDALNQQIAKLDQALSKNMLSPREHAEAVEKLRQKYADTTTAAQRYQDAVVQLDRKLAEGKTLAEAHAQAVMRLSTEFDKAATPADRYELAVAELTKEFKAGKLSADQYDGAIAEQKRTLDLASGATEKHAGAVDKATDAGRKHGEQVGGLGSKIMTAVASYLTFDAILGQVKQALQFVNEEIDKAKASLKGLQPAESQLAQIAKDADDLAQMSNEADRMAGEYGVKREETRAAVVEGRNLDIESKQLESMVKYSDVAATSAQTLLGGKMQAIFGKENVSAEEAVSMGLMAAGASASNFEEMSRGIPSAAEGGRMAGASAEETLSLYSVFAGQFGTAQTGAERIKALGAKISKSEQLKGLGFSGAMEKMAGMKEEELFGGEGTVFGQDTESRVAYETLKKELPAFKAMTAKIAAEKQTMRGGGESFIGAVRRQVRRVAGQDRRGESVRPQTADAGRRPPARDPAGDRQRAAVRGRGDQGGLGDRRGEARRRKPTPGA